MMTRDEFLEEVIAQVKARTDVLSKNSQEQGFFVRADIISSAESFMTCILRTDDCMEQGRRIGKVDTDAADERAGLWLLEKNPFDSPEYREEWEELNRPEATEEDE